MLLEAAKGLSPNSILEISRPRIEVPDGSDWPDRRTLDEFYSKQLLVSFSSAEQDSTAESDTEKNGISMFIGERYGIQGQHYRTEDGKLQKVLAYMIANDKQLITKKEVLASGVLGYIEVVDVGQWEKALEVPLPMSDYERYVLNDQFEDNDYY